MKHLLVPTDFSETANAAIEHALALAESTGASITLVHVIYTDRLNEALLGLDAIEHLSKSMDLPSDSSRFVPAHDLTAIRSAAKKKLDEMVAQVDRPKVTINTVVLEGRPSRQIKRFAEKNEVDLIVMGTHGRGPVGRMFLGSVTENVIRASDIPVVVIRK